MDEYTPQGFNAETPRQEPEKKQGMPIIVKIILIIVGIGAFIMIAPVLFCFLVLLLGSL